jgi:hypothetical protein
MTQVGGGSTFVLGEEADVLCFDCGATFVVTLTPFGWVSREATAADRERASRDPLFNRVRLEYAQYREKRPGTWSKEAP